MIKAVRLEGSSMLPLFKPGEIVLVEDNCHRSQVTGRKFTTAGALVASTLYTLPSTLRSGDCVVYSFEGRSLLHRVIAVEEAGPLISDDAGRIAPHKVPWSGVTGRIITSNPLKKGLTGLIYSKLRRLAKGLRLKDKG